MNLGFDPRDAVAEARANGGQAFLGTVMSLTPSGKYYTPFANSNVDPCPGCNGKGEIRVDRRALRRREQQGRRLWNRFAKTYGLKVLWPQAAQDRWVRACRKLDALDPRCRVCNGCGSAEEYKDELWREEAETELSKYGAWLESGEGDPCDLFVCVSVDEEEDDEDEEDGPLLGETVTLRRYTGIACRVVEDKPSSTLVSIVMVGDDRRQQVDRDEVTPIEREAYCGECGQIGCSHDGLER